MEVKFVGLLVRLFKPVHRLIERVEARQNEVRIKKVRRKLDVRINRYLRLSGTLVTYNAVSFLTKLGAIWIAEARAKDEIAHILTEWYAKDVRSGATPAYVVLLFCFFFAIIRAEYAAAMVVASIGLAIFSFGFLTKLRAAGDYFADNGYEALEILRFIISKHKSGGLPPGTRLNRSTSRILGDEIAASEQPAGVRA